MADDLVKRWDEYVEGMGSVMGEVEHMAQQMRDRIEDLEAKLEKAVDALESVISCSNDVRLVHDAEATLTELKGQNT